MVKYAISCLTTQILVSLIYQIVTKNPIIVNCYFIVIVYCLLFIVHCLLLLDQLLVNSH